MNINNANRQTVFVMMFLLMSAVSVLAQSRSTITIEECYTWSKANYPLVSQLDLIEKTTEYNISNAAKGILPQVNINGQATYQSDVTALPIKLPNVDIQSVSKDQYKIYAEIFQPLTNQSIIKTQKELLKAGGEIEKQSLEVSLYQLKERINQIYFGMLLIDKKNQQLEIAKSDLEAAHQKLSAAQKDGIATLTDLQVIEVEKLSVLTIKNENDANRKAFLRMLALLTGKEIDKNTKLLIPLTILVENQIYRPELKLFELQNQALSLQNKQLNNKLIPNAGLFLQAGYGRPALNFLINDFTGYYIGGLKFQWNLSNFYTSKKDKSIIDISKQKIEKQKEVFLLNTKLTMSQQSSEIEKFEKALINDIEIVKLRKAIKETSEVKLSNGIITSTDYVKFLNDLDRANQNLALHEVQYILAQYNHKTTSGN